MVLNSGCTFLESPMVVLENSGSFQKDAPEVPFPSLSSKYN